MIHTGFSDPFSRSQEFEIIIKTVVTISCFECESSEHLLFFLYILIMIGLSLCHEHAYFKLHLVIM